MNKELKEKLKKELEKERNRVIKELEGFAKKDSKIKGNWKSRFPVDKNSDDNTEEAAAERVEEYSTALPIEHSLELKLKNINIALEKMEKGKYGICENCNKKISIERLEICPEARVCLDCVKRK
jgi:DnaK suppressor protein